MSNKLYDKDKIDLEFKQMFRRYQSISYTRSHNFTNVSKYSFEKLTFSHEQLLFLFYEMKLLDWQKEYISRTQDIPYIIFKEEFKNQESDYFIKDYVLIKNKNISNEIVFDYILQYRGKIENNHLIQFLTFRKCDRDFLNKLHDIMFINNSSNKEYVYFDAFIMLLLKQDIKDSFYFISAIYNLIKDYKNFDSIISYKVTSLSKKQQLKKLFDIKFNLFVYSYENIKLIKNKFI